MTATGKSAADQARRVFEGLPSRIKLVVGLAAAALTWFVLAKVLYFGPIKLGPESRRNGISREYWEGWDRIENVFSLCVICNCFQMLLVYEVLICVVETRGRLLSLIRWGCNRTRKIRLGIQRYRE